MKRLSVFFILFILGGCQAHTVFTGVFTAEVSHDIEVVAMKYPGSYSYEDIKNKKYKYFEHEVLQSRVVKDINKITTGEARSYAQAINLKTGKKFHIGNIPIGFQGKKYKYSATELAKLNCELLYESECVISIDAYRGNARVFYRDLNDFNDKKLSKIEKDNDIAIPYFEYTSYKALARPVNFGKGVKSGYGISTKANSQEMANKVAIEDCEKTYGKCLLFYEGNNSVWEDNQFQYAQAEAKRRQEYANYSQEALLERQRQRYIDEQKKKEEEEEKRVAVLVALKERCIEYGFTGNNNIASCIQREAQHDFEIEQQKYQVQLLKQELANQRMYASQNTQQVDVNTSEEVPWWLEILGAVAVGAAEGYKQQQIINTLDNRYQKKSIYRYQPQCGPGTVYSC